MANFECPYCKLGLEAISIFSNCQVCTPDDRTFSFFCPQCGENSWIMVDGSFVVIGGPDGFPEPCFIEAGRLKATGISVTWSEYEADVAYNEHHWKIGVTDHYRKANNPEYRAEFVKRSKKAHERRHRQGHPE